MATVRPDILVKVGSGPLDAVGERAAVDTPTPYVEWSAPLLNQFRFSVKIACVESGATAVATSGPRTGTDQHFRFPVGVGMGPGFAGLCTVEVALSQNSTGDFEFISPPFYFVYDPYTENLFRARKLTLRFNPGDDPDALPQNGGRQYHAQVASDPLFMNVLWENSAIAAGPAAEVSYDVPQEDLTLETNRIYFFRVRMSDGLDFGDWSIVNAFRNFQDLPPVVRFVSVGPSTGDAGDVLITFDIDDAARVPASVEFYYVDGTGPGDRQPLSLVESAGHLMPGRHSVTWRTMNQISRSKHDQIMLFARARDSRNYGPEAAFGPAVIDNSAIPVPVGGIGTDRWRFSVAGWAANPGKSLDLDPVDMPVQMAIGDDALNVDQQLPVAAGQVWKPSTYDQVLPTQMPTLVDSILHIAGQGLSPLDGVYVWVPQQTPDGPGAMTKKLDHFLLQTPTGPVRLPATVTTVHGTTAINETSVTRQFDGGCVATTGTYPGGITADMNPIDFPARGILWRSEALSLSGPVAGETAQPFNYFFSGISPDSHPGHALQPRPGQLGGFRVSGSLGRSWSTVDLGFAFLQAYWDAYNTVHWRATASETSSVQIQFCRVLDDGSDPVFIDVRGDNAAFSEETGRWITDPLVFNIYWDTSDRTAIPSGGTYRLRIRQCDPKSRTIGDWVYSSDFQIINGITNPVSILSEIYEPWSKTVTIELRCDSSTGEYYTLTNFWYSTDDGFTWKRISIGDISGARAHLSSLPGENRHVIVWDTSGYNVIASNNVRVKIACAPAEALSAIQVPFFKWLTPANPYVDAAESQAVDLLGRWETRVYDPATGTIVPAVPPVRVPGTLTMLQQQAEGVRQDPSTGAPQGAYSFLTPDANGSITGKSWPGGGGSRWAVADQDGYKAWLAAPFTPIETHAQALSRISQQMDYITAVQLPALQKTIAAGEKRVRKRLMDQGYFAEEFFPVINGKITETITAPANGVEISNVGNDGVRDVVRWWRFRVQTRAEGPDGVYDADGNYAPVDLCDLERVLYEFELDAAPTFDSQSGGNPLRRKFSNYDGSLLAVATATSQADSPDAPAAYQGAVLKLPPSELPGKVAGDELASGQESFEATYQWRVAAYNRFTGDVTARPRPRITAASVDHDTGTGVFEYLAQAHPMITTMSLGVDPEMGGSHVNGYAISGTFLAMPAWVDETELAWISDRRAPLEDGNPSRQINSLNWVWPNTDRKRVSFLYDEAKGQYVGFMAKSDPNDLSGQRHRIVGIRAMELGKPCEYDVYFADNPALAIYGPCVVRVNGTYRLYVTVQDTAASQPRIMTASSSDGDSWSALVETGVDLGANPSVVFDGTHFVMFFEKPSTAVQSPDPSPESPSIESSGYALLETGGSARVRAPQQATIHGAASGPASVQVHYATSVDGVNFGVSTQATADPYGAQAPGAVRLNGAWVVYYQSGNFIVSVAGLTPGTLSGRRTERSPVNGFSPMHPMPFVDLYQGNEELFLAYTARKGSDYRTRIVRLEDRVWVQGNTDKIFGAPGHLLNVPSSAAGIERQVRVDLRSHGISEGASIKVRLNFTDWSPTSKTYLRQSDWVSASNAEETGSVVSPESFTYTSLLDAFPYLRIAS